MLNQVTRGRSGGRGCLMPLLILGVLVVVGFLGLRACMNLGAADSDSAESNTDAETNSGGGLLGGLLGGVLGGGEDQADEPLPDINRIVSALNVDDNGCAVDVTDSFYANEPVYIVVPESLIPRNTELFVRLSNAAGPIEDADPIVSESDLRTCTWFVFQPRGAGFDAGTYTAELFINGRTADNITFTVGADGSTFAPGASGGSTGSTDTATIDAGLQRVVAGYDLDPDGCAVTTEVFRPAETVYLSAGPGYIPAGTEIGGTLAFEGRVIEEAQPLRADQEMNTCVYFAFEPGDGFEAGVYEGTITVDGATAGTATFEIAGR